jgi:hypothetical protein
MLCMHVTTELLRMLPHKEHSLVQGMEVAAAPLLFCTCIDFHIAAALAAAAAAAGCSAAGSAHAQALATLEVDHKPAVQSAHVLV